MNSDDAYKPDEISWFTKLTPTLLWGIQKPFKKPQKRRKQCDSTEVDLENIYIKVVRSYTSLQDESGEDSRISSINGGCFNQLYTFRETHA